jgi:hypothetical protein
MSDSVIYVGGDFLTMGGQPRNSLAALDPVTGLATPWNPGANAAVHAVTLLDGVVYVGGWFDTIDGVPRRNLAAVDRNGTVTSWSPDADDEVQALAASDSTIYAGGFFTKVAGEDRPYFAALDAGTGAVRHALPQPDDQVWALATSGGIVYLGGAFGRIDRWPQVGFAAVTPPRVPPPPQNWGLTLAQCVPNPVGDEALIRFTIPVNQSVSLTIFDVQGRATARLLSHAQQTAGPHQVALSAAGWRPGCYLYRLEAGGRSLTRKMVVFR